MKRGLTLVLENAELDDFQSVFLLQNIQPIPQDDHGVQLALPEERHHFREPLHDDL